MAIRMRFSLRPTNADVYNHGMGATALQDLFDAFHVILHRCRGWTRLLFTNFAHKSSQSLDSAPPQPTSPFAVTIREHNHRMASLTL